MTLVGLHSAQKRGVHGAVGDIVDTSSVQNVSNKNLDACNITNSVLGAGTFTLVDATTSIVDDADPTKIFKVELGGQTTGTTITATPPDSSFVFASTDTIQTVTGAKTFGAAGAVSKLKVAGTTSGAVTINTDAVAGTAVITVPAVTDTLVGKATTDVFTNKTYDTAGTGNAFAINGLAVTASTGTGSMVRATSPSFTTPSIASPTITGTTAKGGAAGAAGAEVELRNIKTTADATDASHYTITVPNAIHGAMGTLTVSGMLGDGDATHAQMYNFAISRIAGAATSVTLSAAVGSASNIGATGNAVVLAAIAAAVGAVGSPQTLEVNVRCTRSAGTATNHKILSRLIMLNANASGVTVVAN